MRAARELPREAGAHQRAEEARDEPEPDVERQTILAR
jgi:hypothetical protein